MRDAEYGCLKYATHTWSLSTVTVDGIVTTSCSYCGAGGERMCKAEGERFMQYSNCHTIRILKHKDNVDGYAEDR